MQHLTSEARRKFLFRYFLGLFAVIVVPVALMGGLFLFFVNNYLSQEIESRNRYLLKQTAQISTLIFRTFDTVNLLISSDVNIVNSLIRLTRGDGKFTADDLAAINSLHNTLGSMIGSTSYLDSVNIYLKGAVSYYSSKSTFNPMREGDAFQWMSRVMGGDSQAMHLYLGGSEGQPGSRFSVYRDLFSVDGIAVVNIDLRGLREDMAQFLYYQGQAIYISDGSVAISLAGDDDSVPQILGGYASMKPGMYQEGKAGKECLVAVDAMERSSWKFIVITPFQSLYSLQRRLTLALALVLAACVLIGIAVAVRVEKRNYDGVVRILNAIELAESGVAPSLRQGGQDVYTYILNTIIEHKVLRNYMEAQMAARKYQMETLELKALQFQINPHFLVNTLKTIYWKDVELNGMDAPVCRMMENLLDITGYSLSDGAVDVTLKEELRHARSFAEILMARHADELEIRWNCGREVEGATCKGLLIQPFIENAFYHGIRASSRRPGLIEVCASIVEDLVLIRVRDNGVGMSDEKLRRIRASLAMSDMPSEHIGIYNPHRRIVLAYGEGYGVALASREGEGTEVTISFPYQPSAIPDATLESIG